MLRRLTAAVLSLVLVGLGEVFVGDARLGARQWDDGIRWDRIGRAIE